MLFKKQESVNPSPPEWLDTDTNTLLRGDAIGDTVYTHRWILKCLFTITNALPLYLNGINKSDDAEEVKSEVDEVGLNSEADDSVVSCEIKNHNETSDVSVGNNDKLDEVDASEPESKSDSVLSDHKQPKGSQIEEGTSSARECIMELDCEVEDAACQLWDMSAEKAVTNHLLELEEVNIIELVALIAENSLSPRLSEVMIGVAANICCQKEGCEKVLASNDVNQLLEILLNLLGKCSDVPTICECLRLMRLLLWHRINRTPKSSWAGCPLLKLLCQDSGQSVVAYLLNNSLSDILIQSLLELLSNLLFICLPEIGLTVASLFTNSVLGLMDILERKSSEFVDTAMDNEQNRIVHLSVMCLSSFIDTPGALVITKEVEKNDSKFENILLKYFQFLAHIETIDELTDDIAEQLCHTLCLCQLIIPNTECPTFLMMVGKLLSLINGQTNHYSVSRSTSKEEVKSPLITGLEDKEAEESIDAMEGDSQNVQELGDSSINPNPDDTKDVNVVTAEEVTPKSSICDSVLSADLADLKQSLEDYCFHLLAWWWSGEKSAAKVVAQKNILDILDQCHVHEVLLILKAVRSRDPTLVPRLQEHILDDCSHQRLVALLAQMYQ